MAGDNEEGQLEVRVRLVDFAFEVQIYRDWLKEVPSKVHAGGHRVSSPRTPSPVIPLSRFPQRRSKFVCLTVLSFPYGLGTLPYIGSPVW